MTIKMREGSTHVRAEVTVRLVLDGLDDLNASYSRKIFNPTLMVINYVRDAKTGQFTCDAVKVSGPRRLMSGELSLNSDGEKDFHRWGRLEESEVPGWVWRAVTYFQPEPVSIQTRSTGDQPIEMTDEEAYR